MLNDKHLPHIEELIKGSRTGFFMELEKYAAKQKEFDYENFYASILKPIDTYVKTRENYVSYFKKTASILATYFPYSAVLAYAKYLTKTYQNPSSHIKALQKILAIDNKWYGAYVQLAYVYCEQKDWEEAIRCFETAISASVIFKNPTVYFNLAWCYDAKRQYRKSSEAYEECLRLAPEFRYVNNNLGLAYLKLKDYDKALVCFEKSIKLGTDGVYPYRNKLDALVKANRNDEATIFAKENPEYFKTKYYVKLLAKAAGGNENMEQDFIQLEHTTENTNAGTIEIKHSNSGLSLYAHQQDAIRDMNKKILRTKNYSGLLVLPTGGGKTLTATHWLMGNILESGQRVIWLAHRHELLNQARTGFEKVSFSDVAHRRKQYSFRVVSGLHDKPVNIKQTDDIIIASKTSLYKGFSHLLENWLAKSDGDVFLVIDEAHHATAKEYRELVKKIRDAVPSLKVLGLTATPFRTAGSEQGLLKKIFHNDIAYKIDLRELIARGILAEPIFEEVNTEVDMTQFFRATGGAEALNRIKQSTFFDIDSIGKKIATDIAENAERNKVIVEKYLENAEKYGQTLIFALNVTMAIALNKVFQDHGVKSDYVVSDIRYGATGVVASSEENAEKIQKFRDEELNVLINVNILTEGTDLPKVRTVFLTRPTKSTILMTQMIGRALRGEKAGGTKDCYIVSFVDDWQSRIAWVNPEELFTCANADFNDQSPETRKMAVRLVAIKKIEEFAAIANDTIDERLEKIGFMERIPIGIYKFSYLLPRENDEDDDIFSDVLVYDCVQQAYKELFDWLPHADLSDVEAAANHANDILFKETDRLIGYTKNDVLDIIHYFKQTGEPPEFIEFCERNDYDVSRLARHIIENRLDRFSQQEYVKEEWNQSSSRWQAFYGLKNEKAFRKSVDTEVDKILNPDCYKIEPEKPITHLEQRQIQDLPLYEIRQKYPELGEKIKTAIFGKFTDADGNYYCKISGYKSRRKLDFHIDHITAMANGGKTVLENLQLLKRSVNMEKGAK